MIKYITVLLVSLSLMGCSFFKGHHRSHYRHHKSHHAAKSDSVKKSSAPKREVSQIVDSVM